MMSFSLDKNTQFLRKIELLSFEWNFFMKKIEGLLDFALGHLLTWSS